MKSALHPGANFRFEAEAFFELINRRNNISSADDRQYRLFGRIERCVINEQGIREVPLQLTYRPHRHAHVMDPPCSFVAGSEALARLAGCNSLRDLLESIALDPDVVRRRLKAVHNGILDHLLILFSSEDVPVVPADLDGILSLLALFHAGAYERFSKMVPLLKLHFVGPSKIYRQAKSA
jgi:hypothetical protein